MGDRKNITEYQRDQIIKEKGKGTSAEDVAKKLGIRVKTIRRYVQNSKYELPLSELRIFICTIRPHWLLLREATNTILNSLANYYSLA